eukprot:6019930-Alexandrium_andersonii.AAC.1
MISVIVAPRSVCSKKSQRLLREVLVVLGGRFGLTPARNLRGPEAARAVAKNREGGMPSGAHVGDLERGRPCGVLPVLQASIQLRHCFWSRLEAP